jgi:hypothetical protein
MALTEIQPTLPPEGAFTNPELNFIDESPRGFFPENQDSNWGWKRKVYTDEIQELFDQLELIYAEAFPQTSQEFLDEWEFMVGLPQSPQNKTLAQRRSRVINRLRGGPFTRTMRREIIESYITATFGDPILLLPPGVEMIVAGQPLYNEPGDVTQLYMVLETVEQFQYEVRIKSGMGIDQVGLERDLRHFTPAGIFIIFNYAWEGKFPTDAGTSVDDISSRVISVAEAGTGVEAIGKDDTDTATATDIAQIAIAFTDEATSTETAEVPTAQFEVDEGGFGTSSENLERTLDDTGTGTDDATKLP